MRRLFMGLLFLSVAAAARGAGVTVHVSTAAGPEGNSGVQNFQIVFTNQFAGNLPLTGDYTTVDGTATAADNDYVPVSGTFVIPTGETSSEPILIGFVGDTKIEPNETFSVVISNVQGGVLTEPGPYIFTIVNDDIPVVTVTSPTVPEGNSGTRAMTFDVTLTAQTAIPVQATYATANGTATAGEDYQPGTGTITFAPGEVRRTVDVNVIGDTAFENNETLTLTVTPIGGGPASGIGTITNDDVPAVTVSSPAVAEGDSGTKAMTFDVTLTAAAGIAVQATYTTTNGTATAGEDYQPATGTITFAPGEVRRTVDVNVLGDTRFENNETLTLTVTPGGGAPATGTGTITNDDQRIAARILIVSGNNQSTRLGLPLANPLVVQVVDDTGAPVPGITVQWRVTQGTATLDPASSVTGADGRASTNVTATSVGAIQIEASAPNVAPVTFTVASQTSFESRARGPVAVPIARTLDIICARNEQTFNAACRALSVLSDNDLTPTLERVAPQQSGAQSKVASEVIATVVAGVSARLNALRGGVQRLSVQQVALNIDGQPIPVGAIATALFQQEATDAGGSESDYNGWSAYFSGNLGEGERIGRDGALGFDLKSRGLMFGVDRMAGQNIFGASLNLMQLDAELTSNAGSLDTSGYAISLYASRVLDAVHFDASLTLGHNQYDSEHIVDIPGLPLATATSENDASILAFTGGTGFEAQRGRTDFDLSLSGTWSRADVDDLEESGSGPLILFVQGHEIESLTGNLALSVRSAFPVPFGTLLPNLRGELVHEFQGGARLVTARFVRDSGETAFTIPIDRPDTNYGRLAAGLQAVFPYGWSAYVEVTQDVLRSDLHFRGIQFNVLKSF